MFLTLISMLSGGLLRLLPDVLTFFNKKTDNAHELAMLDRQLALEASKSAARLQEIQALGANAVSAINASAEAAHQAADAAAELAYVNAQGEAMRGQMQKIGIWWVDALNFLVRPLATYYMLLLYGATKLAMFMVAIHANMNGWEALLKIYDGEDRAILSGILAFWFVGRQLEKK